MDQLNILIAGKLNEAASTATINDQIKLIQSKLSSLTLSLNVDSNVLSQLSAQLKLMQDAISNKPLKLFDPTAINAQKLEVFKSIDEIHTRMKEMGTVSFTSSLNPISQQVQSITATVKQADDLISKYKYDLVGIANRDGSITPAYMPSKQSVTDNSNIANVKAQEAIDKEYSQFLANELKQQEDLERQHYLALQTNKKLDDQEKRKIDADYVKWWADTLKQEEALDRQHYLALQQNAKMDEQARLAQQQAQQDLYNAQTSRGSIVSALSGSGGFSTTSMIAGLAMFTTLNSAYEQIVQGMQTVETGSAKLSQVFEQQNLSQSQLNKVTNDFIAIGQHYGQSIDGIMQSAAQWGRQYKDINTSLLLTNQATLLSVVDAVDLQKANSGLEATMNSMNMAAKTQAEAFTNSSHIINSWSNLAHNAAVSATDLIDATTRSGGAATAAGVSFDQLQALATSAIRNSGLAGANIGNMLKSLFASIQTDKSQKALDSIGVSLKQIGSTGQEEFRPVFDVLLELSQKMQTADENTQKVLESVSGGKQQWSKVASMLSDTKTIWDGYAASINSANAAQNYAQQQMDTLSRDIQRLKDSFVSMASATDQGGLGTLLKDIVKGLTDLILGLEQLPSGAGKAIETIGLLLIGLKTLTVTMTTLEPVALGMIGIWGKIAPAMGLATAATEAETVATGELTAAWTALDTVSGGLALAIGAIVGGIALFAINQGKATQAAQDHTHALQDNVSIAQQDLDIAKQKQQFMQTAIDQEAKLKAALDDTSLSAENRNKIMNDMINMYHAVGKVTGDTALQQVDASNVMNQSLDSSQQAIVNLVNKKKEAYQQAVTINNQEVQNDLDATNQQIDDINKKIAALNNEMIAKASEMSFWQNTEMNYWKGLAAVASFFHDYSAANQYTAEAANIASYAKNNDIADLQKQLPGLQAQKAQDEYKIASNNLDLANMDVTNTPSNVVPPPTTKTSSAGIPSVGSAASAETKQVLDANTVAMDGWNAKLKESQAIQAGLSKTSAEYISLQNDQITYYQQMQDVLHNQADGLREVNSQIQQQIDNGGLNEKQQQQLQLQIDSNNAKIAGYSATWFTYQKNIADIQASMQDNQVADSINKAKQSLDPYDQKIKDLTHSMDLMLDGDNAKVQKQGDLISAYIAEDDQIQKNIDSYQQLASTLDQNSSAYAKLQQEITSQQDKLASNQTSIYNARVKAAQDEVAFVKKAYQDELNAKLAVIDAEKKAITDQATTYEQAIQDEINALDRQNSQQTYSKSLEKEDDSLQKIQNQINSVSLDNSAEAKSKLVDLRQQLADEQDKIAQMQNQRDLELRKQNLQDTDKTYKQQVTDQQSALDQQKTQLQQHYDSILNDDSHWLQVEKDMISGNTQSIQQDLKNLSDDLSQFIKDNANKVGIDIQAQMTQVNNLIEQTKQHAQTVSSDLGINSSQSNQGTNTTPGQYMNDNGSASIWSLENLLEIRGNQYNSAKDDTTKQQIHDLTVTQMQSSGAQYNETTGEWVLNGIILNGANKGKQIASFGDGGFTGTWSDASGKLAFLHSGEFVLNNQITQKILSFVDRFSHLRTALNPNIPSNINNISNNSPNNTTNYITFTGNIADKQTADYAIQSVFNQLRRQCAPLT